MSAYLGARLRTARMLRGWTQREFAERHGTRQSAVSEWETGAHGLTVRSLLRIAAELNVTVSIGPGGTEVLIPVEEGDNADAQRGAGEAGTDVGAVGWLVAGEGLHAGDGGVAVVADQR